MLINTGGGKFERQKNIIGVFDIEKTTVSKITRRFLKTAEKNKKVQTACEDIPKSFFVLSGGVTVLSDRAIKSVKNI